MPPDDDGARTPARRPRPSSARSLSGTLAETGIDLPEHVFTLGAAYTMLRFWVRLYGQVALEVFGRFPYPVSGRRHCSSRWWPNWPPRSV